MQSFDFKVCVSIATANGPPEEQPRKIQPEAERDPKQHLLMRGFLNVLDHVLLYIGWSSECIEYVIPCNIFSNDSRTLPDLERF